MCNPCVVKSLKSGGTRELVWCSLGTFPRAPRVKLESELFSFLPQVVREVQRGSWRCSRSLWLEALQEVVPAESADGRWSQAESADGRWSQAESADGRWCTSRAAVWKLVGEDGCACPRAGVCRVVGPGSGCDGRCWRTVALSASHSLMKCLR